MTSGRIAMEGATISTRVYCIAPGEVWDGWRCWTTSSWHCKKGLIACQAFEPEVQGVYWEYDDQGKKDCLCLCFKTVSPNLIDGFWFIGFDWDFDWKGLDKFDCVYRFAVIKPMTQNWSVHLGRDVIQLKMIMILFTLSIYYLDNDGSIFKRQSKQWQWKIFVSTWGLGTAIGFFMVGIMLVYSLWHVVGISWHWFFKIFKTVGQVVATNLDGEN